MILFLDTENTTWNNGNPFDERNFNVCIGYCTDSGIEGVVFHGEDDSIFRRVLSEATLLVNFNIKYDLHWLRKLGYDFSGKRVFCNQVAEFFLGRQSPKYPDLDGTCASYNLARKLDVVKTEYWDKGINTHEIPRPVLWEYCSTDVTITKGLYYAQMDRVRVMDPSRRILLSLMMQDLLVLEEIEWNGLKYNEEKVKAKEDEVAKQILELQSELGVYHAVPNFNWASPAHISALLFGGTIKEVVKVPDGSFKSGQKVGQQKFRNEERIHVLPRMYKPPKGAETKKEGVFSVDEDTLLSIKGGKKELIDKILKVKELAKIQSTYLRGLREKHQEMHWPKGMIHGQYNQVVASTGRLSSSNPNMQNYSGDILDIFETRY